MFGIPLYVFFGFASYSGHRWTFRCKKIPKKYMPPSNPHTTHPPGGGGPGVVERESTLLPSALAEGKEHA